MTRRALPGRKSRRLGKLSPLPQLFPRLYQLLHGAGRRKRTAIDDAAVAIGLLVEVLNRGHAQAREGFSEGLQVGLAHHVIPLAEVATPGHEADFNGFATCS